MVPSSSISQVAALKTMLLCKVAPLDRGVAASSKDRMAVEEATSALEDAFAAPGGGADCDNPIDEQINGKWRLVYSSTFAGQGGGTQGFTGSPTGGGPLQLGQVFQRIQARKKVVDNIVEIRTPSVWPFPDITGSATLSHSLNLKGPKTIEITFENVTVRVGGALRGIRPLAPPQLPEQFRPPPALRSGSFATTFVDSEMRVSRGDRGELRIFVKTDKLPSDE